MHHRERLNVKCCRQSCVKFRHPYARDIPSLPILVKAPYCAILEIHVKYYNHVSPVCICIHVCPSAYAIFTNVESLKLGLSNLMAPTLSRWFKSEKNIQLCYTYLFLYYGKSACRKATHLWKICVTCRNKIAAHNYVCSVFVETSSQSGSNPETASSDLIWHTFQLIVTKRISNQLFVTAIIFTTSYAIFLTICCHTGFNITL